MKSKTVISILFVGLVFAALFIWGYNKDGDKTASVLNISSTNEKGALTASSTIYDFGTISMRNGNVSHDFVFTNSTDKDLTIIGVETSCMCTSALLVEADESTKGPFGMPGMGGMNTTNDKIKAGETKILRVIYNPNAHGPAGVGAIDRLITVTSDSGKTLQFEIKALVTP